MNRKTVIAGAVFIALFGLVMGVMRNPEKGTRTTDRPRPMAKLTGLDLLEITQAGAKSATVIKKTGNTYKVLSPIEDNANADVAESAFDTIEMIDFDGVVTSQKSKHGQFEVGDGALRIIAKKGDKTMADLRIGAVSNNVTMVRLEGKDEVWKAVGLLKSHYDKSTSDWRNKAITTFTADDAEQLQVVSKTGGRITLAKPASKDGGASDTEWRVVESTVAVDPLDTSIASGIVSTLSSWQASDFADEASPADTGLDAPNTTVTVQLKGGKKVTVLIGNKKGEDDTYVRNAADPRVFLVKKYNVESVNKRPIEFRDKVICNLSADAITAVSVTGKNGAYTLIREAGKTGDAAWKATQPAGLKLDTSKVGGIVSAFSNWKADSFAEDNSAKLTGLGPPSASISVQSNIKGSGCVLKVGAETSDKQKVYVARVGAPDVYVVPKWSLDRVLVKVEDLKNKS
jgi:hypothetical protein